MTVTELIITLLQECEHHSKDPSLTQVNIAVDLSNSRYERVVIAEPTSVFFDKDHNGDCSIFGSNT